MKFNVSACIAVLAAIAQAKVEFTNNNFNVVADTPFELTWAGNSGPVTIYLKDGPSGDLKTVSTLASSISGTSTTVTLKSSELKSGDYAFSIKDTSSDPENYSKQFAIVGTGSSSSSTSMTATATTTTSSSSSVPTSTARASNTTGTNATTTSARTSTTATTTPSTTAATPPNTGAGAQLQSSLALVFLGFAAYAFLN